MNRFFLLVAFLLGAHAVSFGQDVSLDAEIMMKFREYRSHAIDAAFPDYPDEARATARKKAFELRDELIANPEVSAKALASVFDDKTSTAGQRVDVINFFAMTKIGKDELLPIIRNIVKKASLEKDPAPLLSASATYLYDFGDRSDIELLERLKGHVNPSFVWLANYGIKKLKNPKDNTVAEKSLATQKKGNSTPEPIFVKKPPAPDKQPTEPETVEPAPDNPFPYWIFIVGGVVVIGLVVVLRRK